VLPKEKTRLQNVFYMSLHIHAVAPVQAK
jgi:hypothetical protein